MTTYRLRYNQIKQQPGISGMFSALERGFQKFQVDFYLVGAVAKDIWLTGIHKIAAGRITRDFDFAVFINQEKIFAELRNYFIQTEGFAAVKDNDFVLIWKDKTQVDLLPFSHISQKNENLNALSLRPVNIRLEGFAEVYENGLPELDLEGEHHFKFCTLPGIVLLKLIAWDDRPEKRQDDIKDISDILTHFFSIYDQEIWKQHNDLFDGSDMALIDIAARVMGREISKIARRNPRLFSRVDEILCTAAGEARNSRIAAIMARHIKNTIEENVLLLQQVRLGLNE
ncbi:hypothetical protein [Foetidibacter luteolus]|uniref:hypothetical protein n=1 Tax=Foetidibacter luteolus TaxID=2608880 RepID=UPI00129AE3AC|nr:hypothetical protein [Foetidibacter luteolus]